MNPDRIPIRISHKGHVADGSFEGAKIELHLCCFELGNGSIEVFHFKRYAATISAGSHAGGDADCESAFADVVLDPMAFFHFVIHRGNQAENTLVEGASSFHIGDGIAGKGNFVDLHACTLSDSAEKCQGASGDREPTQLVFLENFPTYPDADSGVARSRDPSSETELEVYRDG